ncbi:MAG: PAS domain-containing protein [Erysipelotrichaceae bacterium]|nr:PAS domain-containing protein [Erysipelotrichaceae bacterium]MBQ5444839.1 PAS domain-containing protein [Erysipelotrichaceae bacterium]MBR3006010.1 PAS domain-containing protein [Erysipelotrichaceae bacterium]
MKLMKQVKLTKTDRQILNSYIPVLDGLANYLSSCYELVLHSLEDYDHSVICIYNGEHTGRKVGAPITDLALKMLEQIEEGHVDSLVYFSRNAKGEPLKSTTLAIRGEGNKVIGLLCINMYMNVPLIDMINSYVPDSALNSHSFTETYTQNPDELIESTLEEEKLSVLSDSTILPSNKNKIIIERLYDKGIFQLKDSVIKVEKLMGISKNTIYMHIRNHKKNLKEN